MPLPDVLGRLDILQYYLKVPPQILNSTPCIDPMPPLLRNQCKGDWQCLWKRVELGEWLIVHYRSLHAAHMLGSGRRCPSCTITIGFRNLGLGPGIRA